MIGQRPESACIFLESADNFDFPASIHTKSPSPASSPKPTQSVQARGLPTSTTLNSTPTATPAPLPVYRLKPNPPHHPIHSTTTHKSTLLAPRKCIAAITNQRCGLLSGGTREACLSMTLRLRMQRSETPPASVRYVPINLGMVGIVRELLEHGHE
jgi:hypothetical protein